MPFPLTLNHGGVLDEAVHDRETMQFFSVIEGTDAVYRRVMGAPSCIGSESRVIPNEIEKAQVEDVVFDS